jgi:hypothetical protein
MSATLFCTSDSGKFPNERPHLSPLEGADVVAYMLRAKLAVELDDNRARRYDRISSRGGIILMRNIAGRPLRMTRGPSTKKLQCAMAS